MCHETIVILYLVQFVCEFWCDVRSWLQRDFKVFIELNPVALIFCYLEFGINLLPKNVLILSAKTQVLIVHTVIKD